MNNSDADDVLKEDMKTSQLVDEMTEYLVNQLKEHGSINNNVINNKINTNNNVNKNKINNINNANNQNNNNDSNTSENNNTKKHPNQTYQ